MRLPLLLGILCLSSGCLLVRHRGPYPMPPPQAPQPGGMDYNEAVSLGLQQCQFRGYRCELKEAHRTGNGVWKVKFNAFTSDARGHLHLDFDDRSRALLKVNDKVKAHKGGGHGKGRGKGKDKWDDDDDD